MFISIHLYSEAYAYTSIYIHIFSWCGRETCSSRIPALCCLQYILTPLKQFLLHCENTCVHGRECNTLPCICERSSQWGSTPVVALAKTLRGVCGKSDACFQGADHTLKAWAQLCLWSSWGPGHLFAKSYVPHSTFLRIDKEWMCDLEVLEVLALFLELLDDGLVWDHLSLRLGRQSKAGSIQSLKRFWEPVRTMDLKVEEHIWFWCDVWFNIGRTGISLGLHLVSQRDRSCNSRLHLASFRKLLQMRAGSSTEGILYRMKTHGSQLLASHKPPEFLMLQKLKDFPCPWTLEVLRQQFGLKLSVGIKCLRRWFLFPQNG